MKNLTVLILLVLSIAWGCVTMPTQSEISNLDCGSYPHDYEAIVKAYYNEVLFDPYSAQYEFTPPKTSWYKEAPLAGGRLLAGYLVVVRVNAKNRMGGYVGKKTSGFLLNNGQIIKRFDEYDLRNIK